MSSSILDTPAIAIRLTQTGASPAQAEVLREALHTLGEAIHELQETQAKRDAQYVSTSVLAQKITALEDNTRHDAAERATKSDIALVRKDLDLLRKDVETQGIFLRKDMEVQGTALRKDMAALENKLIIKLGSIMVVALGALAAFMKLIA